MTITDICSNHFIEWLLDALKKHTQTNKTYKFSPNKMCKESNEKKKKHNEDLAKWNSGRNSAENNNRGTQLSNYFAISCFKWDTTNYLSMSMLHNDHLNHWSPSKSNSLRFVTFVCDSLLQNWAVHININIEPTLGDDEKQTKQTNN